METKWIKYFAFALHCVHFPNHMVNYIYVKLDCKSIGMHVENDDSNENKQSKSANKKYKLCKLQTKTTKST